MQHRVQSVLLVLLATVAGFASLALELTLARLLAPAFGTSSLVWTCIIGVVLLGLSVGAYVGGRLADRFPSSEFVAWVCIGTAFFILLLPFFAAPMLHRAAIALAERSASIFIGALVSTLVLALPPMLALGMVSPFVIRLRAQTVGTVGTDAGTVSSLATAGSILGSFLPTLWTIPSYGVRATILGIGTLLLLTALPLVGPRKWWWLIGMPIAAILLPAPLIVTADTIATAESAYQFIAVDESPTGVRTLRINEGVAVHSIYIPGQLRTVTIYDAFALLPGTMEQPLMTMANVGLAGGTIAHTYQQVFPDVRVTGMEIDPVVIELGKAHFTLNEPNLTIVNNDGRIALAQSSTRFDAIVVDAYRQPYIPFQLATEEFFALCRDRLTDGGTFAMNVATMDVDDPVLTSILATLDDVFDEVWMYSVPDSENFLVLATDAPGLQERLRAWTPPEPFRLLHREVVTALERIHADPATLRFTDDLAPVERFTDAMLLRAVRSADR